MTGRRGSLWLMLAATIVAGAVAQAASAIPGLGRMPTWLFLLAAAGSVITLWLELVVTTWVVAALATRRPLGAIRRRLFGWAGLSVGVTVIVAVVFPWILPLVALAVLCVLPAVAAGRRAHTAFIVFAHLPGRSILAAVVTLVGIGASWVVALLAGFFLTGAFGAAVMWLWFGVLGAALLLWWARLGERAARQRGHGAGSRFVAASSAATAGGSAAPSAGTSPGSSSGSSAGASAGASAGS